MGSGLCFALALGDAVAGQGMQWGPKPLQVPQQVLKRQLLNKHHRLQRAVTNQPINELDEKQDPIPRHGIQHITGIYCGHP